jgi:hypothetical protein
MNETEAIIKVFQTELMNAKCRLSDIWNLLPESLNAVKTTNPQNPGTDKRVYQVCGRELQATVLISHAYSVVSQIYGSYGQRVHNAKNGNIDFRSLSHAFRAALQCKEIVETGNLQFPLKDAVWLREVKLGHIDFFANSLDQKLDDLIAEVSDKMAKSNLPEKVDQEWVNNLIKEAYSLDIPSQS